MSNPQFLRTDGDDPFVFEEFEDIDVQQIGQQKIQTLQNILQKKSPKDFVYQQYYAQQQSKSTKNKEIKKTKENLSSQSTLAGLGRVHYDPYDKNEKPIPVFPSQYTVLSEKLLQNVIQNPQLAVSTLVQNHPQDSNYFLAQVPTYQFSYDKKERNFTACNQKQLTERLSQESQEQIQKNALQESSKMEFTIQNRQKTLFDSDNFYKNEQIFLQKKQEQIKIISQHIQEQELEECQQKPQISNKSKVLANKQNADSNVVDRLNKKKKVVEVSLIPDKEESKFQPQISEKSQKLKREQKVELMLYQDASRRQKQRQMAVQNIEQQLVQESIYKQNRKSQNAFIKKFIREFKLVSDQVQLANKSEVLTYIEMQDVINNLGFLQSNENVNRTAVFKVWNELKGQQYQIILKRNLVLFLLAVQKLCYNKIQQNKIEISKIKKVAKKLEDEKNEIPISSSKLLQDSNIFKSPFLEKSGTSFENTSPKGLAKQSDKFDQFGNLSLTYEDVDNIHKFYKNLYLNRLTNRPSVILHQNQEVQHSFHPQINNFSQNLADNRRQKIIQHIKNNETQNVKIDLNTILCYQKQQTLQQNELNKQIQEDQKVNQCSFRPITKDFAKVQQLFSSNKKQQVETEEDFDRLQDSKKVKTSTKKVGGIHRTLELYSLARPRNQRRDKEYEVLEYERDCNECTFSPDISNQIRQYTKTDITSKSLTNIKSAQKEIFRLQKARLDQKVKQEINQKGTTFNQKKFQQIHHKVEVEQTNVVRSEKKQSEPVFKQKNRPTSKIIKGNDMVEDYREDSGRQGFYKEQQQFTSEENEHEYEQPKNQGKLRIPLQQSNKGLLDEDRVPLLFVDVNIQEGQSSRIVVYEGDDSETLANRFAIEHNLDSSMKQKLKELLDIQINSLLAKIDEEVGSEDEENQ